MLGGKKKKKRKQKKKKKAKKEEYDSDGDLIEEDSEPEADEDQEDQEDSAAETSADSDGSNANNDFLGDAFSVTVSQRNKDGRYFKYQTSDYNPTAKRAVEERQVYSLLITCTMHDLGLS